MIRRLLFACVCYIFWEEQYVYIQLLVNITSSQWFVTYLVTWKPFLDADMNRL